MNRLLIVLIAATFAMTAVAAVAETAVTESRAGIAAAQGRGPAEALAADTGRVQPRTAAAMREPGHGTRGWAGNWRGGRLHPPAGR